MMRTPVLCLAMVLATSTLPAADLPLDPATYARILLPVATSRGGAFGSLWLTTVVGRNNADRAVPVFQTKCVYTCECVLVTCAPGTPVPAKTRFEPNLTRDVTSNPGAFVYVPRALEASITLDVRVHDVSQAAQSFGTEMPVVREDRFLTTTVELLDVPMASEFRAHLRVYGISSPSGAGSVVVRAFSESDTLLGERVLDLTNSGFSSILPAEAFPSFPAYAEVSAIATAFTAARSGPVRLEIEPLSPGLVFWAFVSVTNNVTQQVTTIVPQ